MSTTARPSKLGFYPSDNKESTLNGMKKYFTDILGKFDIGQIHKGLAGERQSTSQI